MCNPSPSHLAVFICSVRHNGVMGKRLIPSSCHRMLMWSKQTAFKSPRLLRRRMLMSVKLTLDGANRKGECSVVWKRNMQLERHQSAAARHIKQSTGRCLCTHLTTTVQKYARVLVKFNFTCVRIRLADVWVGFVGLIIQSRKFSTQKRRPYTMNDYEWAYNAHHLLYFCLFQRRSIKSQIKYLVSGQCSCLLQIANLFFLHR